MAKTKESGLSFEQRCYKLLRSVPRGKVTTYFAISKALNSRAYRAVGTAMKKNRDPKVPCHRVILSSGAVGNYNKGKAMKLSLLKKEGVEIKEGKVDLSVYAYKFS